MTEAIIYPCQTGINMFYYNRQQKNGCWKTDTMAAKMAEIGGKMSTGYIMAVGKVSPERGI